MTELERETAAQEQVATYDALLHLIEQYEKKIYSLQAQNAELRRIIQIERQEKIAIESQLQQLQDEVKGILEGGVRVTKQAVELVLSLAEKYNGIMNAARHVKGRKLPWGTITAGVVASVSIASIAYLLSTPGTLPMLMEWFSILTNQIFVAVLAAVVLGIVAVLARRRKRETAA